MSKDVINIDPRNDLQIDPQTQTIILPIEDATEIWSIQQSNRISQPYFIELHRLKDEKGERKLDPPLRVNICEDDDGVRAENEELTIFACGNTLAETIKDFECTLLSTWEGLRNLTDDELTQDAIELRNKLSALFSV